MENIDHLFKSALGDFSEAPPPEVWDALEKRLDGEDRKRPGFVFRWFWVALSICFMTIIGSAIAWKMHSNNVAFASRSRNVDPAIVQQAPPHNNEANASGRVSEDVSHKVTGTNEGEKNNSVTSTAKTKKTTTDKFIAANTTVALSEKVTEQSAVENVPPKRDPQNFNPAATALQPEESSAGEPVEYVVNSSVRHNIIVAETETTQSAAGPHIQEPISEPEFNDEPQPLKKTTADKYGAGRMAINGTSQHAKKSAGKQNQKALRSTVAANDRVKRTIKMAAIISKTDQIKETNALAGNVHISGVDVKKRQTANTPAVSDNKPAVKKAEVIVKKDNAQLAKAPTAVPKVVPPNAIDAKQAAAKSHTQPAIKEGLIANQTDVKPVQNLRKGKKADVAARNADTHQTTSQATASNKNVSKKVTDNKVMRPVTSQIAATTNSTVTAYAITLVDKKEPKLKKTNTIQPAKEKVLASNALANKKRNTKHNEQPDVKQIKDSNVPKTERASKNEITATPSAAVTKVVAAREAKKNADLKKLAAKSKNDVGVVVAASGKQMAQADKRKAQPAIVKKQSGVAKKAETKVTAFAKDGNKKRKTNTVSGITSTKGNKKSSTNVATNQPQPASIVTEQQPAITAVAAPVTSPSPVATNSSASSSISSQMKMADPALQHGKDTSASSVSAGSAANDSNTKKPFWKKYKFEAGVKAGFETGFSSTAANKVVVSPYIEWMLAPRMSLLIQPSFKTSFVRNVKLNGNQSFYNPYGDSTVSYVTATLIPVIVGGGIVDTLIKRTYHYSQSKDSITKTYVASSGHYQEYDLPLLFKYALNSRLSVYGGVNLTYSRYAYNAIKENTSTLKVGVVADSFTISNLNAPLPAPPSAAAAIHFAGNPISGYTGPLYPSPSSGGLFRLGYMLGFSYEYKKRWMIDMLMQQGSAKSNTEGGINLNKALSANYFRFTLGYKLKK